MSTSKHLWLLAAAALSLGFAPAFAAQPPRPTVTCYAPPHHAPIKTPMSALPPPGLCLGSQVKQGGVTYCVNCGTSGSLVHEALGLACVSCKAGYAWAAKAGQCCRQGPGQAPPKAK
jgi:hypothetical protein